MSDQEFRELVRSYRESQENLRRIKRKLASGGSHSPFRAEREHARDDARERTLRLRREIDLELGVFV